MSIEDKFQKSVLLAPFTTFGIGGPADYFFQARTKDDLVAAVRFVREKNLPVFILGCGANILIGDKGFRGVVIKNETNGIAIKEHTVACDSGVVMSDLIMLTRDHNLSGLEHFAGIPSTVGGAIWQNLHFLSPDRTKTMYIADVVTGGEILTKESEVKHVDKDYFAFGYDTSIIHTSGEIVLSITMNLVPMERESIQKRIEANLAWRADKHPEWATTRSAGSIFKKIEGYGAGRLIDQAGLKGHRIGNAEISPKHANFIMNLGGATAKDVMDLIHLAQDKVKEQTGLMLEPEITFVGEF